MAVHPPGEPAAVRVGSGRARRAGERVDEFFATGAREPDDKHALSWRDVHIDPAPVGAAAVPGELPIPRGEADMVEGRTVDSRRDLRGSGLKLVHGVEVMPATVERQSSCRVFEGFFGEPEGNCHAGH